MVNVKASEAALAFRRVCSACRLFVRAFLNLKASEASFASAAFALLAVCAGGVQVRRIGSVQAAHAWVTVGHGGSVQAAHAWVTVVHGGSVQAAQGATMVHGGSVPALLRAEGS